MANINSATVSECGFPEEYLFWVLMGCGLAAGLMSFVISEHTKSKYDGLAFITVFLAIFSDKHFEYMGKVGLLYRLFFWSALLSGLALYGGVEFEILDCDGLW